MISGSEAHTESRPMGTGALSPGVKRVGCETDHYLHLVPRLRMCGATPPFRKYVLMAWCLVKQGIYPHGMVLV